MADDIDFGDLGSEKKKEGRIRIPSASGGGTTRVSIVLIDNKDKAWAHEFELPDETPLEAIKQIACSNLTLMTDEVVKPNEITIYVQVDEETRLSTLAKQGDIVIWHNDALKKVTKK